MKIPGYHIFPALLLLLSALTSSAVVLDNSFDELPGGKARYYQPWLAKGNFHTLPDGRILHYATSLLSDRNYHFYDVNRIVLYPDIYYAVLEFPGQGVFYGLVSTSQTKRFDGDTKLLGGRFYYPDGKSKFCYGKLPHEWAKDGVTKPAGAYTHHTYTNGFGSKSNNEDLAVRLTFNPGGTMTASFIKEYTRYNPQEIAGEYSSSINGVKYKTTTQLTGGWYFDVTASATFKGTWTMKGDTLITKYKTIRS